MPNVAQISDSVAKNYVQLPDGSLAEKIVIVNPDGTGIGGASNSAVGFQQITDGVTKFFVKMQDGTFAERMIAVKADGTALGA